MEADELQKLRDKVTKQLTVESFVEGKAGQIFVGWINGEIARLTNEILKQEYDSQPEKTIALRAELRAFAFIANQMTITRAYGERAKGMIKDSGEKTNEQLEDMRSPEEIQNDAQ